MSGRLLVAQNVAEESYVFIDHIQFALGFSDFFVLYQDPRRFGSVRTVSKTGPKTTGQLATFCVG